ncbi:hypothetical protein L1887_34521 [Cichorium endivia]|nr:hypothetical protein L1887_34521 [Cichorium endivia]
MLNSLCCFLGWISVETSLAGQPWNVPACRTVDFDRPLTQLSHGVDFRVHDCRFSRSKMDKGEVLWRQAKQLIGEGKVQKFSRVLQHRHRFVGYAGVFTEEDDGD